jgi:hypothetical protein
VVVVEDRAQFHVHMLGATRGVMDVKDAIRPTGLERLAHRTVFAGLIARHVIAVRDAVAGLAQIGRSTAPNWRR